MKFDKDFYRNKKILITGHTGFKGSWMCKLLTDIGADVTGYALEPPTNPSLFEMCGLSSKMNSVIGDVRDLPHLKKVFDEVKPESSFIWRRSPLSVILIKTWFILMK